MVTAHIDHYGPNAIVALNVKDINFLKDNNSKQTAQDTEKK